MVAVRRARAPWLWRASVLLVGLLGLNCRDSTGPRGFAGHVAFAPTFESGSAGIVDVDRLRITLVRPPSTLVLDTVIAIPPNADSVDLSLSVPLSSAREDLDLYLRLINTAGDTVFRNTPYPQSITVTSGSTGTVVPAPLEYVGVGYDAAFVVIGSPDTSVLFGDTLQLSATAWGAIDLPIPGTPVAWRSLDSLRVRVPNRAVGKVVGGSQRGPARIVAQLLTGPSDTVLVTAQPVPTVLTRVSGDGQTAVPFATLPQPLRVRVTANDGLGVQVPVAFRALAAGASVSLDTVMSDSLGYAEVTGVLGPGVGQQTFDARVARIATPVVFTATAVSGTVASVTLDRTVDTIARGATLQYNATARDSSGNPVSVTIGWTSTITSVATVDQLGLARGVGVDSTKIIAAAAGRADTALLYVRALNRVVPDPADTVITAVGDSFDIRATAYDNFGAVVTSGFTRTYSSATPTVVTVNATTGRTRSVGPGNGVIVIRDSVDATLRVQAAATVRVNQLTASIRNTPALPDSLQIGVGGRRAIIAQALDRNANPIPNKTFGFRSADPAVATVDAAGIVTGVQLDGRTFVIDSVDGFKDSVKVAVVPTPPALLQWGYDSLAVGNGGNVSVPLTLSRTDPNPTVVFLSSSDTMIARPASGCPGGSLNRLQIPANTASTSITVCGLSAGRATLVVRDSAGVFFPDTLIVTVVSTIEFREIGSFSRQPNFYANQNETHTAQVFLSDPAPAGGLGVTFVYGRPGTSVVTPSPAIIPAGQLSATITIQGLGPGRDSVVPTSGGFVGKFSYVDVAPDSLHLSIPYPYAVGAGQTTQPYVYFTYSMDHPLPLSLGLTPAIGTVPATVSVPTNYNYVYFTVSATVPGTALVTADASGWIGTSAAITFTTPVLGAGGTTSMVAGDPSRGNWSAFTEDSVARYSHPVVDTVVVTAVSRDTDVVAVDVAVGKVRPGQSSVSVFNALRAQPAAGGRSTWIVLTAPGYRPDSFQVNVTAPALTYVLGYPSQVLVGGRFQNAGYVQIPYARPDSFTVVFAHTRRGIVSGPDSVTIPKGLTYVYFDVVGDTVGSDTISIARATGYLVPSALEFNVVPLHVSINNQPSTLYTISRPQLVSVYVHQATSPFYANPLVAPLRVNLASSNPAAFGLDSAGVTIPAGAAVSNYDTLRVNPASAGNDSGRVLISAAGSTNDSSGVIRILPTPLTLYVPYPQQAGYRLKLQNSYASIPDIAPDTVQITLTRRQPLVDSLSAFTVTIPKGLNYSNSFEVIALDSAGTDTVTATALGYVGDSKTVSVVPAQLDIADIGANHLTTEPPYRVTTYVRMRPAPGYAQVALDTVRFTIVSTDSNVIQIDSAEVGSIPITGGSGTAFVPPNQYYTYFRIKFIGSGTARVLVSAPGYGIDTLAPVTVTGPALHLGAQNLTIGVGQVFQNEYLYVDNPVTGSPLVISLAKSDSALIPSAQAFLLSTTSATIPVGQTSSPYFDITGQTNGSAQLIARANGYGQATTPVQVGTPQLAVPATQTLYVGQVPQPITVVTQDQAGASRVVVAPLPVSQTVSDPTVAAGDSSTRTIAVGQYYTTFAFRGLKAGSVSAIFTASGYKADTTVMTVDTGQFSFGSVPTTLGPNQSAQMYVTLPFVNDAAVDVTLSTSPAGVLGVPASATIPARAQGVYFNVTGLASGTASVTATAPGMALPGTSATITVGQPKLQLSLSSNSNVGQKTTLTVYAEDSLGNFRNVTTPLLVTLVSSDPANTVFDSATVTIPTGSYYVSTGITFNQAGGYTITGTASGYAAGNVSSTASGALVQIQAGTPGVFVPATVTINAGQYVTWRNVDAISHTTTDDSATIWNSGSLPPGNTYQHYFATQGTFNYHCTIHPGMTGTVIVNP
jgi:plastocyanin